MSGAPPGWGTGAAIAQPTSSSSGGGGGPYSYDGLKALWVQAGGDPSKADLMAHVALSESGGDPRAPNPQGTGVGLWQINPKAHGTGNWTDPLTNARKAVELERQSGMAPWEDSRTKGGGGGWGQYAATSGGGTSAAPAGWNTGTVQRTAPTGWNDAPAHAAPAPTNTPLPKGGFSAVLHPPAPAAKPPPVLASGGVDTSAYGSARPDPLKAVYHAVMMAGTDVSRGADAVLGAPQRLAAGTMTGGLGHGIYDAWHPNDRAAQQELEEKTERLPIVSGVSKGAEVVGYTAGHIADGIAQKLGGIRKPDGSLLFEGGGKQNDAGFLANVGKVMSAQVITDPLTFIPFVDVLSRTNGARKVLQVASDAAKSVGATATAKVPGLAKAARATNSVYTKVLEDGVQQVFGKRPELNQYLDLNGKSARLSIEEKHVARMDKQAERDEALLKRVEPALRNVQQDANGKWILPEDLRLRYLGEAWTNGTQDMRDAALRQTGMTEAAFQKELIDRKLFDPHEVLAPPPNRFDYNVVKDYQTFITPGAKPQDTALFGQIGGNAKKAFTPFEQGRLGAGSLAPDQYEITANRLMLGRNAARFRAVDHETADYLKAHGGWRGAGGHDVEALSQSPTRYVNRPGMWLGQLGKAGITMNPFPHGLKNVGELAYLVGGPEAFGKGLGYAAKGLDDMQRARLANMGVAVDYLRHSEGPLAKVFEKVSEPQQHLMNRMEMGYRQALLDQLDRTMGESVDKAGNVTDLPLEYRKAEEIRRSLGDYRNVSRFVAALQSIGGPFVAFRLGIVPSAVARSVLRRPDRAEALYRGQTDVNDELRREGAGYRYNPGDPAEDAARLAFKPTDYMTSAATVGPLGEPIHMALEKEGPHQAVKNVAAEYIPGLRTVLPWLGLIPGLPQFMRDFPYKQNPNTSAFADAVASLIGSYFSNPTSAYRLREINRESQR